MPRGTHLRYIYGGRHRFPTRQRAICNDNGFACLPAQLTNDSQTQKPWFVDVSNEIGWRVVITDEITIW